MPSHSVTAASPPAFRRIPMSRHLIATALTAAVLTTGCGGLSPEDARSRSCDDLAADVEREFDQVLAADLSRPATISSGSEMLLTCNGQADLDNGHRLSIWAAYKLTLNGDIQVVYGEGHR